MRSLRNRVAHITVLPPSTVGISIVTPDIVSFDTQFQTISSIIHRLQEQCSGCAVHTRSARCRKRRLPEPSFRHGFTTPTQGGAVDTFDFIKLCNELKKEM